jgi:serine/threonine protein kinase
VAPEVLRQKYNHRHAPDSCSMCKMTGFTQFLLLWRKVVTFQGLRVAACSADMWGAGMLAYMILCGRLPFGTEKASVSVADLYSGGVGHDVLACSAHAQVHGGLGTCNHACMHLCMHSSCGCLIGSFADAGRVNVTRKQAFEALLTFEMDFEGPHFTELSEGAQDLIKSLLQVNDWTFHVS